MLLCVRACICDFGCACGGTCGRTCGRACCCVCVCSYWLSFTRHPTRVLRARVTDCSGYFVSRGRPRSASGPKRSCLAQLSRGSPDSASRPLSPHNILDILDPQIRQADAGRRGGEDCSLIGVAQVPLGHLKFNNIFIQFMKKWFW